MENRFIYYNRALLPTCLCNEVFSFSKAELKQAFKKNKKALFFRYTEYFDCGFDSEWWYCLKDSCYDISSLKSNRRYVINKARKHFSICIINPVQYIDELYLVQLSAFSGYPDKYRPHFTKEGLIKSVKKWVANNYNVFGAFNKETNKLCGYTIISQIKNRNIKWYVFKTMPEYEKMGVNAALIDGLLTFYNDMLKQGFFIVDGERNVLHQTKFQDYLITYFGFRKAYCKVNIVFRSKFIHFIVVLLRPFSYLLKRFDRFNFAHMINGLLLIDSISRKQRKMFKNV